MTLQHWMLLAAALFSTGVFGLLARRDLVGILVSLELMANADNVAFVAFARWRGAPPFFALFALAITVAEVAIGLALVLLVYRTTGSSRADAAREMRG